MPVQWAPSRLPSRTIGISNRSAAGKILGTNPNALVEIDQLYEYLGRTQSAMRVTNNILSALLAEHQWAEAKERSAGPIDPWRQWKRYAWKIPVRRISERYYRGWKVKRYGPAAWIVFNDSREGYFIEFGIHVGANRVRRPINKLSMIWTLRWLERSHLYQRVWDDIFMPRRGGRLARAGQSYAGAQMQSPAQNMGGFVGGFS